MKNLLIGLTIIIVGIIGFALLNRSESSPTATATPTATDNRMEAIQADLQNGAQLIDVRTAQEFQEKHAIGATNLALQTIESGDYGNLQKDQQIYLYCRSGNRSAQAATLLKNAGYTKVTDLGSLDDWQALGGETT